MTEDLTKQPDNHTGGRAGGEYEPLDSRHVTGVKGSKDVSWRDKENPPRPRGEFEPEDSRNVTGVASTPDGRWTNDDRDPPPAEGQQPEAPTED